MDAISTLGSVIELCVTVGDYISKVAGATEAISQYRLKVDFCKSLLTQLQFEPEDLARRKDWETTINILNKPGAPLSSLTASLSLVQEKLGPRSPCRSRIQRSWQKVMWPFDEKQVRELITSMDSDTRLLEVALSLD